VAKRKSVSAIVIAVLALVAFAPIALFSYHAWADRHQRGGGLPLTARIPDTVPPGTKLIIGDPVTQRVLQYTGWDKQLPFQVEWANISGGPGVTEAFHARAIDVGSAANIPPINAIFVGIPVKIITVRLRGDPVHHPIYVLGIAPRARVRSLADLRGKRIAFSRGQAQGLVVLRALQAAGLTPKDVTLVDLPTSGDIYTGALAAGAVDVAPLGAGINADRYLADYGAEGARLLAHGPFRDDPGILYARTETLQDPAKAAALREYVKFWGRAIEWVQTHRAEWIQAYYVKNQGVSAQDAQSIIDAAGHPEVPRNWDEMIRYQQDTIDLLARETSQKPFAAATLFDRRFETVAADAIAQYRSRETAPARR